MSSGWTPWRSPQFWVARSHRQSGQAWSKGGPADWACERSFETARRSVYLIGSKPGCDANAAPLDLPAGYETASKAVVAEQLKRAGVRLAYVLNTTMVGH